MPKTLVGQMEPRDRARMYKVMRYYEVGLIRKADGTVYSNLPFSVSVREVNSTYWNVHFGASGTTSQTWFDRFYTKEEAMAFAKKVHAAAVEYFSKHVGVEADKLGNLISREIYGS